MSESLNFSIQLPVYPEKVYHALLDGAEMSKMTGEPARIDSSEGGKFSLLDGQIEGEILSKTPYDRLALTWRDRSFPQGSQESEVELRLEPTCSGSELVLNHTGIPDGQSRNVLKRWEDKVFRPMQHYFDEMVGEYVADMGDG